MKLLLLASTPLTPLISLNDDEAVIVAASGTGVGGATGSSNNSQNDGAHESSAVAL